MAKSSWEKVDEWMNLYGDKIIRVVYLITNDFHIAEEITQEAFVRAYKSIDSFRGESSAYTWLYRIALNLSRTYLNRQSKIRFIPLKEDDEENVLSEAPEDEAVKKEFSGRIRACVMLLPVIYREVIILHYYEEMKISEIARVLQQPEGTVKSKLKRGREALENILRKEGLEYGR